MSFRARYLLYALHKKPETLTDEERREAQELRDAFRAGQQYGMAAANDNDDIPWHTGYANCPEIMP